MGTDPPDSPPPVRLKDMFGTDVPPRIAAMISAAHPAFPAKRFVRDALRGYDALELTPRGRQIAAALKTHLPQDYPEAIAILVASLGEPLDRSDLTGMETFIYMPHVFFIAEHGVGHWEESMRAQYELTQRFTAEFSIRAFLVSEPERTLARLREWTADPNAQVRRLVSEGTRPRLPWAPRLPAFQRDPSPVLDLLELLRDDPELYVRRSVANNLNDIAKDNPDVAIATCARWMRGASPERAWLVRHALRSVVKQGRADALAVLGYGSGHGFAAAGGVVTPDAPAIGDAIRITFEVTNGGDVTAAALIDLRVHFVKANGATSAKVFKVAERTLAPGEHVTVAKTISLAQHTTRTHYPGRHPVEAIVNGMTFPIATFDLRPAG